MEFKPLYSTKPFIFPISRHLITTLKHILEAESHVISCNSHYFIYPVWNFQPLWKLLSTLHGTTTHYHTCFCAFQLKYSESLIQETEHTDF